MKILDVNGNPCGCEFEMSENCVQLTKVCDANLKKITEQQNISIGYSVDASPKDGEK